ncbi:DUF748 domain-containing protein [Caballeronia sp. LZ062]|uniref:DUF748 domain-containing protein n=1 Tax=unclassified Caballeronia TaxID=2646786 RepID=UPI0028662277|nr:MULTISPECIES: DUF748 domain-containing protein [unclassified Caballeronia]MDR5857030.1 DUF748 domain-containing protein [Caballeronia sp. LZ050]MDR5869573.1 DUF748 domain-containing protein [Caballeronia sp. LZ062]
MSSTTKSTFSTAGQTLRGVVHARRTRRIAIGFIVALLVIGVLSFFVAPPVIRHVAEQQLARQLDRPVSIRRIALNPYTLDLEADDVHIGEAPGHAASAPGFVDVSRLVVRASWASLFRLAPVVDELKIDSPRVSIVRYDAEHFNFSDLIAKFSKPASPPSDKPARFSVSNIRIENGRIDFDDRLTKTKHIIDRFALGVPFIATLPSATDIFVTPLLQARIDGSPLVLKGRTKPFAQSRESEIALTLDGLDVPHMASYAPASLPVAVKSGRLSTDLNVRFAISGDVPTIRIDGTADLADAAVTDRANAPLIAARALHVKIANMEPLRSVYHFDEITLSGPDAHLTRDASGVFNVTKLASPSKPETGKPDDNKSPPLDLAIRHLAIDGGRLAYADDLLKQHVEAALTDLAVTLDGFSTLGKTPARYTLKTASDKGGTLGASGNVTLTAHTADAKIALDALALPPLQPYIANLIAARVVAGTVSANLPVSVDWSKPDAGVQVGAGDVALAGLTLLPSNAAGATPIKLGSAVAKIGKVDVAARTAALDSVQVSGLALAATRRKDGSIDLAALAGPHEAAPEQTATRKVQKAQQAGPAWRYQIGQIGLDGASATFIDETPARPVKLTVAPLSVNVRQFSDDLTKSLAVDGKLALNGRGALGVNGNVTVSPLKLALHVKGDQVDASAFEPYFGDKLNVEVASASLNANGDVTLSGSGKTLAATYKGDASLTDVRMIDKATSDRFAGWKLLGLTDLKASYRERGTDVEAARVTFANFYGRVLLDAQGKLNLKNVVASDNAPAQSVTQPAASAPVAASAPGETAKSGPPLNMRFGQLVLQNGRVTYTDNFIKPNYTANLVAINGTIGAFGTHSTTPAPVDVTAKLAANGPVSIKGQVNPLIAKPALDLTASAHDVELTNLTPYSAKYAGYPITKGKLNVDLHYMLADDKLTANNHLFIDQLTFGDHVDNPSATKLPVRLAVSLLKNSRGEIDVNIPISGSLSNPEFSVGGLVWQAILNLVQKAVTAPFSLLAHAFGGSGEELNYVEFDAGSATLTDAAQKKLDTVAKALADKPSIRLDVTGRVDPKVDEPGLRSAWLDAQVKRAKVRDMSGNGENVDWANVKVSGDDYDKYLTKVYKSADFKKPRNMIGLTKSLPDADMKAALLENAPVDEASLRDLAQRRAQAVKEYFDGKIDSSRIFVVAPKLTAEGIDDKGAGSRVDLGLK